MIVPILSKPNLAGTVVCTTIVLQLQNRFTVSWKSVVWSAAAVRTWPGLTLHCYRVSDDVSVGVIHKLLMIVCC